MVVNDCVMSTLPKGYELALRNKQLWPGGPGMAERPTTAPTCAMGKDTVKLISAEGFEFIVDYQAACVSNTIKNMLSSSGKVK